ETADHTLSRMGAAASYSLHELTGRSQLPPNETADLTLTLTAPTRPGRFASHWQLRTGDGKPIGGPLWMHIGVSAREGITPPPSPRPRMRFQAGMNVNPDAHGPEV